MKLNYQNLMTTIRRGYSARKTHQQNVYQQNVHCFQSYRITCGLSTMKDRLEDL